ncbi:S-layer homology domain-containing protein [Bacillus thuringiensis]|uniref:S-layer homology domain-containing protein n=1 Tax=Bacillus thuringiensis TaxID=1428 RepID=UPI002DBCD8EF|nr:S-layer homology domain-containing protein [Bacillus thuringiensis]MEC2642607.1 S-layer homology domain-containing protein [Bacillus thuringiensis]MEC2784970.1 S-layer homology domain-containing protein [Bacillus thuringiensis]MEC2824177.1 S-layer homology domain-containing protein [Bacillus thuringiensis]MEC3365821.1 S-layer homology domain-containing protein [Bacillus thuringiensis]MEC3385248.1 S-layer homology domain-containing protein [Bacillus thuringiensis]
MKKKLLTTATALTIMGTAVLGTGASVNAADNTDSLKYNDVPANHWSTKAIYDLTNRKVVQGYGNNVFGFGDNVTRGQVARMIYTYVKPADADASFKSPFTDIKGHLFEKEILAVAKAGLVKGFGDGKYGPDDILTREQMAQVLTNAFKFKGTKTTKFADVDKNSWAYGAISALEENGVTIGTGGNMYSPQMHVTREAYSQFLYNSINVVEKKKPETKPEVKPEEKPETKPEVKPEEKPETKPEVKPEEKPETKPEVKPEEKPETKPEVKPEEKPETKPEVKPEEKPETKPEEKLPQGLDSGLATPETKFNETAFNNLQVSQDSVSSPAQNIVKSVNQKYGTNLKYNNIGAEVTLKDEGMYLPSSTFNAQFLVESIDKDNYKILFLSNNNATVELAKEWVKLLTPALNVDKEIDTMVNSPKISNYEKGDHKVRIGLTMVDKMLYVQVKSN